MYMMDQDSNDIMLRIQAGDASAFEQVFHALYEKLCRYAYGFLSDQSECEDAVQQCFIRLWDNRASVGEIKSIKSYMYRAVYNACLNKLQHKKTVQAYKTQVAQELEGIYFSEFDNTLPNEKFERILNALATLPEKNREVFTLRFVDGLSTKAVSKKLNITVRTVETHVSKALRLLRNELKVPLILFFSFTGKNSFFDTWFF